MIVNRCLKTVAAMLLLSAMFSGCSGGAKGRLHDEYANRIWQAAEESVNLYNESMERHDKQFDYEELREATVLKMLERVRNIREIRTEIIADDKLAPEEKKHLIKMCLTADSLAMSATESYRRFATHDRGTGEDLFEQGRELKEILAEEVRQKIVPEKEPGIVEHDGRPNIVFLLIDTMRADHVGTYGYSGFRDTTPRIDAIAAEGLIYENAMSQAPHTPPSVASIMTGAYPGTHRLLSHSRWKKELSLVKDIRAAGYTTAAFSGNPLIKASNGYREGFEHFVHRPQVTAEMLNNEVFKWMIDYDREEPFFLFVQYMDPHDTYNAPAPYTNIYDPGFFRIAFANWISHALLEEIEYDSDPDKKGWIPAETAMRLIREQLQKPIDQRAIDNLVALYDAEITYNDEMLYRLVATFKEQGLMDNTILVITSDHGEGFLEHGYMKHGNTLYDEQVHVPLILWDGRKRILPRRESGVVEVSGVLPALMAIMDVDVPETADVPPLPIPGIDGLPQQPADIALSSTLHGKSFRTRTDVPKYSIRTGRYRLIHTPATPLYELYDLEADPGQFDNLLSVPEAQIPRSILRPLLKFEKLYEWHGVEDEQENNEEMLQDMKDLGYIN